MTSPASHDFASPPPSNIDVSQNIQQSSTPPGPISRRSSLSRTSSFTQSLMEARPPPGMWAATGHALGTAPSLSDLRRDSISSAISRPGRSRRGSSLSSARRDSSLSAIAGRRRGSSLSSTTGVGSPDSGRLRVDTLPILERKSEDIRRSEDGRPAMLASLDGASEKKPLKGSRVEEDLNVVPSRATGDESAVDEEEEPEHKPGWWAVTVTGLKSFWKFFKTPLGFFITIYMLNVVAWGGMLFLLLCNAAPAMCHPDCNNINSPRRIWIEIDSQILNALFCVTGFGLVPWRFRDFYYLMKWRLFRKQSGLMKLVKIHENWFRLPEGQMHEVENGLTGSGTTGEQLAVQHKRAPPTQTWKLDYVIWLYVWNTFFQCCLCGFMWGLNRYKRPSWSTGLFVALACIVAGLAGLMVWWESRKVKKIEGDNTDEPPAEEHQEERQENERGRTPPPEMEVGTISAT